MNIPLVRLPAPCRRRHGFTLVELLIVIAVIGILMGMALPAVQSLREVARRTTCASHLNQLGIALQNYESAYGVLPPGSIDKQGPIHNVPQGYHVSWIVHLLPYVDETVTYKHVDFNAGVYDKYNAAVRAISISLFLCPTLGDPRPRDVSATVAVTTYAGCHNDVETPIDTTNHGALFLNSHVSQRDVTDGTANTIYVGEKLVEDGDLGWMSGTRATLRNAGLAPDNRTPRPAPPGAARPPNDQYVGGFGSRHAGVCNFLFGDGGVRLLSNDTALDVLQQLAHRADGKLLTKGPTRAE